MSKKSRRRYGVRGGRGAVTVMQRFDGFERPCPYRVRSQLPAAVFALRNSAVTDAAQSDDIVPFFAALAAIPTACSRP